MSVVKVKRVGKLWDNIHENLITVKNIIRKERVKRWIGKSKVLLHLLW